MARRRVTAQDVAARAEVSRTTVSFVLNGVKRGNISDDTRRRVLEAAEALGYVPDAVAQALASGRSQTIGLVVSRMSPFPLADLALAQIVDGLLEIARQYGLRLLIDSVTQVASAEMYRNLTHTKRLDGLIMLNARTDDAALAELVRDDFPLVLLGRLPHMQVASVEFDNRSGARAATEHLLGLGHTRIGIVNYAPLQFTGAAERLLGYQDALAAAGIPFDQALVRYGNFTVESGYANTKELLETNRPTALFVMSDTLIFGALSAIHAGGLSVPGDVALVGFDDLPFARFTIPPLTTVRISFEEMGRRAGLMLLERIQHPGTPARQELLPAELIVRESSAVAAHLNNR